jgi:hypothetical protein
VYDRVLKYMIGEMQRNARDAGVGWWIACGIACSAWNASVLARFAYRVRPGGSWDHKAALRRLAGAAGVFWTPIRGDPTRERLRYDVWSNIHYGYVGRAHGISSLTLMTAQRVDGGVADPADDISIRIGMSLWSSYGYNLQAANLQALIVRNMAAYLSVSSPRNVVILPGW